MNAGSGLPYTTLDIIDGSIVGGFNGSRLPWTLTMDARLDKDIAITNKEKKKAYLNVYIQVLNVLNTANIMGVHATTGDPEFDGKLVTDEFQKQIASQTDEQAYRDLYSVYTSYPWFYSQPRRIRIGASFNF